MSGVTLAYLGAIVLVVGAGFYMSSRPDTTASASSSPPQNTARITYTGEHFQMQDPASPPNSAYNEDCYVMKDTATGKEYLYIIQYRDNRTQTIIPWQEGSK